MAEVSDLDNRIMLLYPTVISIEQQFYGQKNLRISDITVSIIEFEISFKQTFFLKLLFEKIFEAFKPVMQVFEHIEQS